MVACPPEYIVYMLPMLLGRTYHMNKNTVGLDIFGDVKPIPRTIGGFSSTYRRIDSAIEKRQFLGLGGALALKIAAGTIDVKGAGEYLKDTSNAEKKVEVLIRATYNTKFESIHPDAQPLDYWHTMDPDLVGTHVAWGMIYGGEVYASLSFVALKSEYMENITAEVKASIAKEGAFNVTAEGHFEKLYNKLSSKAKLEINYYGTMKLTSVPTTMKGLSELIRSLNEKSTTKEGIPLCVQLRKLSEFYPSEKFAFDENGELEDRLDDFGAKFNDLRAAKSVLRSLIPSLPKSVSRDDMEKVIEFSNRLTKTKRVFHEVIGNLDLTKSKEQLQTALNAFDQNTNYSGLNPYAFEIKEIGRSLEIKEDPNVPRAVYTRWGKVGCENKASNSLYIGIIASFIEEGLGGGTSYQCLPENPNFELPPDAEGLSADVSKIGGVRYKSMSVFKRGERLNDKTSTCTVCETPMRPTVKMIPATNICPGDWVQEYSGYLVSTENQLSRSQFICVDKDPDSFKYKGAIHEPVILPVMMAGKGHDANDYNEDASVPCVVCSK